MNRRLIALAVLITAIPMLGCGRNDAARTDARQSAVSQDVAQAKAALTAYIVDFWTRGDTTALARALSPKMVYNYNGGTLPGAPADPATGRGRLRQAASSCRCRFVPHRILDYARACAAVAGQTAPSLLGTRPEKSASTLRDPRS